MSTAILGLAHHLPAARPVLGTARPILVEPGGPSDLVLPPARAALTRAGMEVTDVDLIVFATMTPDVTFPGAACYLQHKLAAGTVGALDLRGQCTGFLMGLMVADAFVAAGAYARILLAAAEVHSSGLDYSERGARVAVLYGDGAAAVVLGPARNGVGLRSVVCHTDGRGHDRFWCEYPASRQHPVRVTLENLRAGRHFPTLDFDAVSQFGRTQLPAVIAEALAQAAVPADRIDCFLLSHILPDVVADAARTAGIPANKLIDAGARHGHLTAASLPVALGEALAEGRIGPGATLCLAACGAGFTWGAAVLTL
jgi:3-oxoacyl-[acyl-carrier-protein] synthase-3